MVDTVKVLTLQLCPLLVIPRQDSWEITPLEEKQCQSREQERCRWILNREEKKDRCIKNCTDISDISQVREVFPRWTGDDRASRRE